MRTILLFLFFAQISPLAAQFVFSADHVRYPGDGPFKQDRSLPGRVNISDEVFPDALTQIAFALRLDRAAGQDIWRWAQDQKYDIWAQRGSNGFVTASSRQAYSFQPDENSQARTGLLYDSDISAREAFEDLVFLTELKRAVQLWKSTYYSNIPERSPDFDGAFEQASKIVDEYQEYLKSKEGKQNPMYTFLMGQPGKRSFTNIFESSGYIEGQVDGALKDIGTLVYFNTLRGDSPLTNISMKYRPDRILEGLADNSKDGTIMGIFEQFLESQFPSEKSRFWGQIRKLGQATAFRTSFTACMAPGEIIAAELEAFIQAGKDRAMGSTLLHTFHLASAFPHRVDAVLGSNKDAITLGDFGEFFASNLADASVSERNHTISRALETNSDGVGQSDGLLTASDRQAVYSVANLIILFDSFDVEASLREFISYMAAKYYAEQRPEFDLTGAKREGTNIFDFQIPSDVLGKGAETGTLESIEWHFEGGESRPKKIRRSLVGMEEHLGDRLIGDSAIISPGVSGVLHPPLISLENAPNYQRIILNLLEFALPADRNVPFQSGLLSVSVNYRDNKGFLKTYRSSEWLSLDPLVERTQIFIDEERSTEIRTHFQISFDPSVTDSVLRLLHTDVAGQKTEENIDAESLIPVTGQSNAFTFDSQIFTEGRNDYEIFVNNQSVATLRRIKRSSFDSSSPSEIIWIQNHELIYDLYHNFEGFEVEVDYLNFPLGGKAELRRPGSSPITPTRSTVLENTNIPNEWTRIHYLFEGEPPTNGSWDLVLLNLQGKIVDRRYNVVRFYPDTEYDFENKVFNFQWQEHVPHVHRVDISENGLTATQNTQITVHGRDFDEYTIFVIESLDGERLATANDPNFQVIPERRDHLARDEGFPYMSKFGNGAEHSVVLSFDLSEVPPGDYLIFAKNSVGERTIDLLGNASTLIPIRIEAAVENDPLVIQLPSRDAANIEGQFFGVTASQNISIKIPTAEFASLLQSEAPLSAIFLRAGSNSELLLPAILQEGEIAIVNFPEAGTYQLLGFSNSLERIASSNAQFSDQVTSQNEHIFDSPQRLVTRQAPDNYEGFRAVGGTQNPLVLSSSRSDAISLEGGDVNCDYVFKKSDGSYDSVAMPLPAFEFFDSIKLDAYSAVGEVVVLAKAQVFGLRTQSQIFRFVHGADNPFILSETLERTAGFSNEKSFFLSNLTCGENGQAFVGVLEESGSEVNLSVEELFSESSWKVALDLGEDFPHPEFWFDLQTQMKIVCRGDKILALLSTIDPTAPHDRIDTLFQVSISSKSQVSRHRVSKMPEARTNPVPDLEFISEELACVGNRVFRLADMTVIHDFSEPFENTFFWGSQLAVDNKYICISGQTQTENGFAGSAHIFTKDTFEQVGVMRSSELSDSFGGAVSARTNEPGFLISANVGGSADGHKSGIYIASETLLNSLSSSTPEIGIKFDSETLPDFTYVSGLATKSWTFQNNGPDLENVIVLWKQTPSEDLNPSWGSLPGIALDPVASGETFTVSMNITPSSQGSSIKSGYLHFQNSETGEVIPITNSANDDFWLKIRTNHAPLFTESQRSSGTGRNGEETMIPLLASDFEDDELTFSHVSGVGAVVGSEFRFTPFGITGTSIEKAVVSVSDGKETSEKELFIIVSAGGDLDQFYSDLASTDTGGIFYDAIHYLTIKGVLIGSVDPASNTQRLFNPSEGASQAEVLSVLLKSASIADIITLDPPQTEISNWIYRAEDGSAYNYSFLLRYLPTARRLGILDADTNFQPELPATREWTATVLSKILDFEVPEEITENSNYVFSEGLSGFSSQLAYDAARASSFYGFIGKLGQNFDGADTILRQEMALVASKFFFMPQFSALTYDTILKENSESGETLPSLLSEAVLTINGLQDLKTAGRLIKNGTSISDVPYTDETVQAENTEVLIYRRRTSSNVLDFQTAATLNSETRQVVVGEPNQTESDTEEFLVLVRDVESGVMSHKVVRLHVEVPDSDGDGIIDRLDHWPYQQGFSLDANANRIPDELEAVITGLDSKSADDLVYIGDKVYELGSAIALGLTIDESTLNQPATRGYLEWMRSFVGANATRQAFNDPESDIDGDGINAVFEYAFGLSPTDQNDRAAVDNRFSTRERTRDGISELMLNLDTTGIPSDVEVSFEQSDDLGRLSFWSALPNEQIETDGVMLRGCLPQTETRGFLRTNFKVRR